MIPHEQVDVVSEVVRCVSAVEFTELGNLR